MCLISVFIIRSHPFSISEFRIPNSDIKRFILPYFPLNFGETTLYKHWPQLSVLYHAGPLVKLELTGSYRTTFWSTSEDELEIDGEKYTEAYQRWVFGFGVLFNIEP